MSRKTQFRTSHGTPILTYRKFQNRNLMTQVVLFCFCGIMLSIFFPPKKDIKWFRIVISLVFFFSFSLMMLHPPNQIEEYRDYCGCRLSYGLFIQKTKTFPLLVTQYIVFLFYVLKDFC